MQQRNKTNGSSSPLSGLSFTWTSAFHQGIPAPTGGQNPTLSARLGLILCLPVSLVDALMFRFPALYIPISLARLCVMFQHESVEEGNWPLQCAVGEW